MLTPLHENHGTSGPLPNPSPLDSKRSWFNMTRTIAHYERIEQIGEGTYGQVYRARCKDTNQVVAMKKIRVQHGDYFGLPPTVIREIKILKRLRHPNLVQMVEVVSSKGVEHLDEEDEVQEKHKKNSAKKDRVVDAREGYKGNIFLVLEYVSHDLTGLMDVAYRFSEVQVKCIFKQLLEALQYMHDNKYIHRDIKSSNILIDQNFRLKLADFGLARCIEPPILDKIHDRGSSQEFTNKVITLWYRPPEILLGAKKYGAAVDIWSAGCILAELTLGKPLFTGKDELDQLRLIFEMLGTPTPEKWEGYKDLLNLRTGKVKIEKKRRAKLRDKYSAKISNAALNLIEKLLELDPMKRLTASRALNSRYFMAEPKAPDNPEFLGRIELEGGHFHEFQTKKKRREAKAIAEATKQTALEMGKTDKEAHEAFDSKYREIMEKVAKEGFNPQAKDAKDANGDTSREDAAKDTNDRRKQSREKKGNEHEKEKAQHKRHHEGKGEGKASDNKRKDQKYDDRSSMEGNGRRPNNGIENEGQRRDENSYSSEFDGPLDRKSTRPRDGHKRTRRDDDGYDFNEAQQHGNRGDRERGRNFQGLDWPRSRHNDPPWENHRGRDYRPPPRGVFGPPGPMSNYGPATGFRGPPPDSGGGNEFAAYGPRGRDLPNGPARNDGPPPTYYGDGRRGRGHSPPRERRRERR